MHNPPDRFSRYHILAISLLIFAVFYRVIGHGLVNIDDPLYVRNLYVVQGLTLDGLRFAFQLKDSLFGPLNWLSYMLDVEIFGGNPAGFHFTNLLLHLLNTILFYSILVRMTGARRTALFAAMLFAVHPLRVETVAWVSDRKDLLAMLFALLSMECYRQYTLQRTVWKYGLTGFFYILALLSKPVLVTLPCTFLLLDLWPFRRLGGEGDAVGKLFKELGRLFVEKIPLFLISLVFIGLTYNSLKEAGLMIADQALPMGVRWANAAVTYMKYLGHVVWPSGLIVMYPQVKAQAPLWQVAGSYATLLAVSVGVILQYRRRPYLLVGWFWFVGNLVPLIGLLRAWPQEMADRYTYFPLIGLILAAAWGMRELARSGRVALRVPAAVSAMVIIALATVSWVQVGVWKDSLTLFQHAHRFSPDNAIVHNNLGYELMQRGDLEAGVEHFKQAVRLNPKEYLAWLNLGATYRKLGKTQDAIQAYLECQSLDPYSPVAHFYLGELYHQSRDGSNAIRQTEIALELLTSQYGPDFEKTLEARARLRQYMEENKITLE